MTTIDDTKNNHMTAPWMRRWGTLLAAVATVLVVVSCGGGVGSGGTGGALNLSAGTVSGFGSILIDGARFDDRGARVEVEDVPGTSVIAEARMGQQVEIEFEVDGVARTVRIEAQARGSVSALAADGFTVLGQTIVVNAAAANGPVTQFGGGYTGLADVLVGDAVEVHGVSRPEGNGFVVQATRVEKLAALPAYLKVAGVVSGLGTSGGVATFRLGGLTVSSDASVVVPAGRSLANDQSVVVLAQAANLTSDAMGPRLNADRVRIKERDGGPLPTYLSGIVARLDTTAQTLDLAGLTVVYSGATVDPSAAALADGRYVQVRGSFAADGSFAATRVKVRDGSGTESEAELKGTLTNYDAAAGRFSVRDVAVALDAGTALECPLGLADGRFVEVHGRLGPTGVIATEVHCEDEPDGAIVERDGIAGTPDTGTSTFVLTPSSGAPSTVRWTAQTYFGGLTTATLAGQRVEVQGYFDNGVLVAQKVKLDD